MELAEIPTNFSSLTAVDKEAFESCVLPKLNEVYQPIQTSSNTNVDTTAAFTWKTFISPFKSTQFPHHDSTGCIFLGEIFQFMPLSVFTSLVGINYEVPGLVALLKHPQKRHMLVKSLPPRLIAPLVHRRRYLHRLFDVLQLMASLGLISLVDSPCKATPQPANRDLQIQMIYVHKRVRFYDTSTNRCADWDELVEFNRAFFDSLLSTENSSQNS